MNPASWAVIATNVVMLHFVLGLALAAGPGATMSEVLEGWLGSAPAEGPPSPMADEPLLPFVVGGVMGWDGIMLTYWLKDRKPTY